MKVLRKHLKKLTLVSVAGYVFIFAVCAKGVFFYASRHPAKEELLSVEGVVKEVRLGGDGKATRLRVESDRGTHRYSSYYGKVWPGMEHIDPGAEVELLAERNKLNKNELFEGKTYYIWELTHRGRKIVDYDNVRKMVEGKEAAANRFINLWLQGGFIFLSAAYLRKVIRGPKGELGQADR